MKEYIMSILGIVLFGIMIEIILPAGSTSKYIKSIYSIFVLVVLITPIVKLFKNPTLINISYSDFEIDKKILSNFYSLKVAEIEKSIANEINNAGMSQVEIKINYSVENNELIYNSCEVNLKNLVISNVTANINKYEAIRKIIENSVGLTDEEILFYE